MQLFGCNCMKLTSTHTYYSLLICQSSTTSSLLNTSQDLVDYEEDRVYPLVLQAHISPLTEPLVRGWKRVVNKASNQLCYLTPDREQLFTFEEIEDYINRCGDAHTLEVHQFSFNLNISLHSRPLPKQYRNMKTFINDISKGTERKPIICFNNKSSTVPSEFTYISSLTRSLHADVTIVTDKHFMTSCDCTDGCGSSDKCSCRQMTAFERSELVKQGYSPSDGYVHKRLPYPQVSGIFECNQYCSCGPKCNNRLVQNGVQHRLAVFMTEKMGWGVMTLDDIPQGGFVSVYNGLICNGKTGDKRGMVFGDEYLTELDYIEVLEQLKEGYEDNVVFDDSPIIDDSGIIENSDQSDHPNLEGCGSIQTEGCGSTLSDSISPVPLSSSSNSDESFFCVSRDHISSDSSSNFWPSCRQYFGEDNCYVVDSKFHGNVGRFFNHNCSPNLFVQNVFIDTHDLRFPWVAFFASRNIKAFSELFWDYSYVPGSVEGRSLACLCGSEGCRKILL